MQKIFYIGPHGRKVVLGSNLKTLEFKESNVEVTGLSEKEIEECMKYQEKGQPIFKIEDAKPGKKGKEEVK